ncbi:MAG TPA: zinc ribbon domain-containing protein YjdM [Enteractinococcus sp.]
MSDQLPGCPECQETYTYQLDALLVCPMCGHEWSAEPEPETAVAAPLIRDAVGNELNDGDTVTIIKDLKVKGAGGVIKVGTKVTNIRLIEDGIDDHDIDARVPGFGNMQLKSTVVKKAG